MTRELNASRATSSFGQASAWMERLIQETSRWIVARIHFKRHFGANLAELSVLNDRDLADIGLTREQVFGSSRALEWHETIMDRVTGGTIGF
jgi:uncharacterized protein YjiS (DUF1127 family)